MYERIMEHARVQVFLSVLVFALALSGNRRSIKERSCTCRMAILRIGSITCSI